MFPSEHVIQIRESMSRVRVHESPAHPVFSLSFGGSFPSHAISVTLPAGIFNCLPLRKIITQRNFLCHSKGSQVHHKFFQPLSIRRLKYDFSRILSLLIRPLNFKQNDLCATSDKNTNFKISKNCCVKSGLQILYAVEQFSSLFSKDKLKQGAHIHQTHDPPSLRMSRENC